MAVQTLALVTKENAEIYVRELLERLTPQLVWVNHGMVKNVPKNNGDTVSFRRINSLAANTDELTEGTQGTENAMSVTKITATLKQYGDYMYVSDKLDMLGLDPVIMELSGVFGEQGGLSIDTLIETEVSKGTNVQYANGRADLAALVAGDILTGTEVKKAVRNLKSNYAKRFSDGFFHGIVDSSTAFDLQGDTLWQDVSKYNGGENIQKGELGKLHGVKFFESEVTRRQTGTAELPVHSTVIFGQNAYGSCNISKGKTKPEIIVKPPTSGGAENALNQRGSVGWKTLMTSARLNENAIRRIDHAVSA